MWPKVQIFYKSMHYFMVHIRQFAHAWSKVWIWTNSNRSLPPTLTATPPSAKPRVRSLRRPPATRVSRRRTPMTLCATTRYNLGLNFSLSLYLFLPFFHLPLHPLPITLHPPPFGACTPTPWILECVVSMGFHLSHRKILAVAANEEEDIAGEGGWVRAFSWGGWESLSNWVAVDERL